MANPNRKIGVFVDCICGKKKRKIESTGGRHRRETGRDVFIGDSLEWRYEIEAERGGRETYSHKSYA